MDFKHIERFNYTYAIQGGAWLEDREGNREWVSKLTILREMGQGWFERQFRKQGMFTGCWIEVAK